MQFGELKTEVESWLIDLPNGASSRVGAWINSALREAQERHNFLSMERIVSGTFVQTANQNRVLVSKPSDWKDSRSLPYLVNQDGSSRELEWAASESDMIRTYAPHTPYEGNPAQPDTGAPRYLLIKESNIEVYPLPDTNSGWNNGNYRVVIPYWCYLPDLVANSDTNFITINAPYYCIYRAASIGFKWARDEERSRFYEMEAEKQFKKLMRIDKLSRFPDRLNLSVWSGANDKKSRLQIRV